LLLGGITAHSPDFSISLTNSSLAYHLSANRKSAFIPSVNSRAFVQSAVASSAILLRISGQVLETTKSRTSADQAALNQAIFAIFSHRSVALLQLEIGYFLLSS
jgi:hypothetical protein